MTDTMNLKAGRMQVPRSRGAVGGALLVLGGLWAGLVPFVGPYGNLAFTPDPNATWKWTAARGWLEVLPGGVAVIGGLLLITSTNRVMASAGGWLGVAAGGWLVVGPALSEVLSLDIGTPDPNQTAAIRATEAILFFYGIGAAIVLVSALAIGRLSVHSVRDVQVAERRAAADAEARAEEARFAEEHRLFVQAQAQREREAAEALTAARENPSDAPESGSDRPGAATAGAAAGAWAATSDDTPRRDAEPAADLRKHDAPATDAEPVRADEPAREEPTATPGRDDSAGRDEPAASTWPGASDPAPREELSAPAATSTWPGTSDPAPREEPSAPAATSTWPGTSDPAPREEPSAPAATSTWPSTSDPAPRDEPSAPTAAPPAPREEPVADASATRNEPSASVWPDSAPVGAHRDPGQDAGSDARTERQRQADERFAAERARIRDEHRRADETSDDTSEASQADGPADEPAPAPPRQGDYPPFYGNRPS